jgi:transcriptional regulator with XRE-family HTH domain
MIQTFSELRRAAETQNTRRPSLFSLRFKHARKKAKLTQVQVAEMIGVAPSTVFRWERGQSIPKEDQIKRLVDTLGMNEDDLWIDTYRIPIDMYAFLTTTVEGEQVTRNIRKIMNKLELTQKPTLRKGVPEDGYVLESAIRFGHRNKVGLELGEEPPED